ncbi:UNVERIFIED_CONTAM: two-component system response regulator AtoC [Acetivibrio alkalicellulosi]
MPQNSLFENFNIIGNRTLEFMESFKNVLNTNSSVLITGETGTGKELAAKWLHFSDAKRKNKPFVKITIPNISENIFESEIFGYEKGAFTGAISSKKGLIEVAKDGSVFFDEIENASPSIQGKLLQLLEDRLYRKIGDTIYKKTDARFIIATNKNLYQEVQNNNFRSDLFYRLAVIELNLPPLRDRESDLLDIANFYIKLYSSEMGKNISLLTLKDYTLLSSYKWPGNIRELKNFIERSVIFSNDNHTIDLSELSQSNKVLNLDELNTYSYKEYIQKKEKEFLEKALLKCNGNVELTAKLINMSVPFVYKKIKELNCSFPINML